MANRASGPSRDTPVPADTRPAWRNGPRPPPVPGVAPPRRDVPVAAGSPPGPPVHAIPWERAALHAGRRPRRRPIPRSGDSVPPPDTTPGESQENAAPLRGIPARHPAHRTAPPRRPRHTWGPAARGNPGGPHRETPAAPPSTGRLPPWQCPAWRAPSDRADSGEPGPGLPRRAVEPSDRGARAGSDRQLEAPAGASREIRQTPPPPLPAKRATTRVPAGRAPMRWIAFGLRMGRMESRD